jgi:hypothetical protein
VSAERGKQFLTGFLKLDWELIIENLGLKPRRSTTALPLNTSAFTKYIAAHFGLCKISLQ